MRGRREAHGANVRKGGGRERGREGVMKGAEEGR